MPWIENSYATSGRTAGDLLFSMLSLRGRHPQEGTGSHQWAPSPELSGPHKRMQFSTKRKKRNLVMRYKPYFIKDANWGHYYLEILDWVDTAAAVTPQGSNRTVNHSGDQLSSFPIKLFLLDLLPWTRNRVVTAELIR